MNEQTEELMLVLARILADWDLNPEPTDAAWSNYKSQGWVILKACQGAGLKFVELEEQGLVFSPTPRDTIITEIDIED